MVTRGESLSEREFEVIACLAEGLTNAEIADRLYLSISTIKWYVWQLNSKLDTTNRDEIVKRARATGLLDATPDDPLTALHNLPRQTTSFVGRDAELDELAELLGRDDVQLVTVLAPGGMGKTRLALEAAEQQLYTFADGVYFVALQPLVEPDQIVPAIAHAAGMQFAQDTRPPKEQLLGYLRDKHLLLVLDNWEHLLDGAPLVSEILRSAPDVIILATSREKLNLSGETVYTLRGMRFPPWETPEDALRYDAVRLLVSSARRVRPDFEVSGANLDTVARVCRLTEGMPLGILLATGWLDALPLERICDEIQRNVDFLETDQRDTPDRQRSVRAVFESAWERLSPAEQDAFMKLAVFRGGCTPEAAEAVTGVSLRTLLSLVNKALLMRTQSGRYDIHELLRQYGFDRLVASGMVDDTLRTHSQYFADFLDQREADLKGRRQLEATDEIEAELDNIHQAWYQALADEDIDRIGRCISPLFWFLSFRGRTEFVSLFDDAVAVLRPSYAAHVVFGRLLGYLGTINYLLLSQPDTLLREALAIGRSHNDTLGTAFALRGLAYYPQPGLYDRAIPDRIKEAKQASEESIRLFEQLGDGFYVALALHVKGYVLNGTGDSQEALAVTRQSLAIRRRIGDEHGIAHALYNIAVCSHHLHCDLSEIAAPAQEALAIRRRIRDPYGLTWSLLDMANVTLFRGDLDSARSLAQESLQIARKGGAVFRVFEALIQLCHLDIILGQYAAAQQKLDEASRLEFGQIASSRTEYATLTSLVRLGVGDVDGAALSASAGLHSLFPNPNVVIAMGFVMAERGDPERGLELASLGLNHWFAPPLFRDSPLVTHYLDAIRSQLPADVYAAAWERGQSLDLDETIRQLAAAYGTVDAD